MYRVIADPFTERFVVLEKRTDMKKPNYSKLCITFTPSSPAPTRLDFTASSILSGAFVKEGDNSSRFFYLNKRLELCCDDEDLTSVESMYINGSSSSSTATTTAAAESSSGEIKDSYSQLFAPTQATTSADDAALDHAVEAAPMDMGTANEAVGVLQGGAVHAAPPMDRLLPTILAALLPKRDLEKELAKGSAAARPLLENGAAEVSTEAAGGSSATPFYLTVLEDPLLFGLDKLVSDQDWAVLSMAAAAASATPTTPKAKGLKKGE